MTTTKNRISSNGYSSSLFEITHERVLITPAMAKGFLLNQRTNRLLKPTRVQVYARAMLRGEWRETHQGLAFDHQGALLDGQHRLQAIIKSDQPQWMLISRGYDANDMVVIDNGAMRSDSDAARIIGMDTNHHDIAVGNRMFTGIRQRQGTFSRTREEKLAFVEKHMEAIRFSEMGKSTPGAYSAAVRAPIACAWYSHDRHRLEEFKRVFVSGIPQGREDVAAALLWKGIVSKAIPISGGEEQRSAAHRRVCWALKAFLERRFVSRIMEVTTDPFPLPKCFD